MNTTAMNLYLPEPQRRARAVRAVAAGARDAGDLAELLDMLGLDATDALPESERPRTPVPGRRKRGKGMPIAELTALLAAAGFDPQSA